MRAPLLLLASCGGPADRIVVAGRVFDGRGEEAAALSGATVESYDLDGDAVAETTSGGDGGFEVELRADQAFHLVVRAGGYSPTSFTGAPSSVDFAIADHEVWARSEPDLAAIADEFAGCAGATGGVVEGEVRLYLPVSDPVEELPIVTTATVSVETEAGESLAACYLDDGGESAPESEVTGATGRFAVFGVPEGRVVVQVDYAVSEGVETEAPALRFVPDAGTAPMYPAWAEAP